MVPGVKLGEDNKMSPKHTHRNLFSMKGENLCPYDSESYLT